MQAPGLLFLALYGKVPSLDGCDYTEGKWVQDSRRPIYSGKMCKHWLSGMWACRLTLRPDFSYEKYRWQPNNCNMPDFEGQHFLTRMQDKTLVFVGDSLGRQQFQSIMCLITGGKDSPDVLYCDGAEPFCIQGLQSHVPHIPLHPIYKSSRKEEVDET
jgi:hypothetical protein